MVRALDALTARLATAARAGTGRTVGSLGPRPTQALTLYDAEGDPWCRPVRDALTTLDLEALVLPCPPGGTRFVSELERRGGKALVPYLVDPDAGVEMYETDEIVEHLHRSYAAQPGSFGIRRPISRLAASLARRERPTRAQPSQAPATPLELWNFEACPFCARVRTALCRLELPCRVHPLGKGSPGRAAFRDRHGKVQVPYLHDPNTGVGMFESADIVAYLETTYGR